MTNKQLTKPQLLAPAGDLEKLAMAYHYGADAAYIGGGEFSLRSSSGMDLSAISQAVALAHSLDKKIYLAVNSFINNADIEQLRQFLPAVAALQPDALIISDPGVLLLSKELAPAIPIHISTQANNTNYAAAEFWYRAGASRIILARELSLAEAAEITAKSAIETELFIHGAMCISFSGRCLLSQFMTGRSANQGNCSHPCRYRYALQEEQRPGEFFPIEEDARGSYIMNSKDLCLLGQIPTLCRSGFAGLKIEGRNKSAYYVANVVRVYRAAIDAYMANPQGYVCQESWQQELAKISHREYTEAFAVEPAGGSSMRYHHGGYLRDYDFVAIAKSASANFLLLEQRNHIKLGDSLEILLPNGNNLPLTASRIYDEHQVPLDAARHPKQTILIPYAGGEQLPFPLVVRRPTS